MKTRAPKREKYLGAGSLPLVKLQLRAKKFSDKGWKEGYHETVQEVKKKKKKKRPPRIVRGPLVGLNKT